MRKFVIYKNRPGCVEGIECWEYFDKVEEVEKYPYVMFAIDKYGVEDTLPIAMNKLGGYHSVQTNRIVAIIESETWPTYKVLNNIVPIVNKPDFKCGWISPDGTTYSCSAYHHINLADQLVNELYNEKQTTMIQPVDDFLIDNGWIKISSDGHHYYCFDRVSDKAISKLLSIGGSSM